MQRIFHCGEGGMRLAAPIVIGLGRDRHLESHVTPNREEQPCSTETSRSK
jgi:hypothetical protein